LTQRTKQVPFSMPTPGSGGDTSSWRTERPVLDESKCINCLDRKSVV
jgi:Pyruvate/2-oxoacid:ferredoxin oxidoreductase delta subunit